MIKNFIEHVGIEGHLEILKIFKDGKSEKVFDDHNVIVSGMGVGLSLMFSLSGASTVTDFHLDRVQLGISGNDSAGSAIYELSAPLSAASQYGDNSNIAVVSATQIKSGADDANQVFALIPFANVSRVNDNTIRYNILIDENTANNLTLNEIGLFMKNPEGRVSDASILAAYREFSSIEKTNEFSLLFRWSITF